MEFLAPQTVSRYSSGYLSTSAVRADPAEAQLYQQTKNTILDLDQKYLSTYTYITGKGHWDKYEALPDDWPPFTW